MLLAVAIATTCDAAPRLSGKVRIDGSSTVHPIMAAAAEMFAGQQPRVRVTVGTSGTSGGFKKFLEERADLRTDINNASRPISKDEIRRAESLGVAFIELPVAIDGLSVVVNPANTYCEHLTVPELKRIWEPGSQINNWRDVRPGFPDLPLKLYGAGTDSGTFDYFTEAIVGKVKSSRSDYTASENDNVLVQGVAGDPGALGYFGFAYYEANAARLKLLAIDGGNGPVKPTAKTIHDGSYTPLSRPLFIYVNKEAAARDEVKAFVHYFFNQAQEIVEHPQVGYVSLGAELYSAARQRFDGGVTGTACTAGSAGKSLSELYGGR